MNDTTTTETTAPAPAQPTIDTGADEYASISSYEAQLKKGLNPVLVQVHDFTPGASKDDANYYGWTFTFVLVNDTPGEDGVVLPAGTRLRPMPYYTVKGQFDLDDSKAKARAKNAIIALNNIQQNTRIGESVQKASQQLMALEPHLRFPTPMDTNQEHFNQWKGTVVRALIKMDVNDAGEPRAKLIEIQAKDTPEKAPRK